MPRASRDERLDTRTARLRLQPRREPYWRNIQEGRAIGYRRLAGEKGGAWIAKYYDPTAAKPRQQQAMGVADDYTDADAKDTLTYAQAQDKARKWFAALARSGGAPVSHITVAEAMTEYLADYAARGGKALPETRRAVNAHILPALGNRKVEELTPVALRAWLRGLATAPARVRSKATATKPATRAASADPDASRARRATANRVLTTLKAALNLAFRENRVGSDGAWRRVQPFAGTNEAKVRHLDDNEMSRLIGACDPGFRRLVTAAWLTGCRYGELKAIRPRDLNVAAHKLTIPTSKGGKARHVVLTDEAVSFFAEIVQDKRSTDLLLVRDDGEPWGASWQSRPMRDACKAAKISPVVSFHILRHTHASRLAAKGVPMAFIAAQLGHADIKMTSKHYAHLAPDHVSNAIRAAFGELGVIDRSSPEAEHASND